MKVRGRRNGKVSLFDSKIIRLFLQVSGFTLLTLSLAVAGMVPDVPLGKGGGIEGSRGRALPAGSQLKKNGELTLTLVTTPSPAVVGEENLLQLVVTDAVGRTIENARVLFSYTTPARDRGAVQAAGTFRNGQYEAPARFEEADDWDVTVSVLPPGQGEVQETFSVEVIGPKKRK